MLATLQLATSWQLTICECLLFMLFLPELFVKAYKL